MGLKITLPTGETIEVDADDWLSVDFDTPKGKAAYQEIVYFKDSVKNWANTDLAEIEDELKSKNYYKIIVVMDSKTSI